MADEIAPHTITPPTPTLYLFPSNLSDAPLDDVLPQRNILLISQLRYFIVENVRTARRFLKRCDRHIDIDSLTFFTLDVNTDPAYIPAMLAPMAEGHSMGIISEAGCPAVADPGALVVEQAHRRGYRVAPLVGPSSIILALMASGFNGQSFTFNGYLPIEADRRAARLKQLYNEARHGTTQIFIETPYRNNKIIKEIIGVLPPTALLCMAFDLTGPNQKVITLPLSRWAKREINFDKTPAIFLLYAP